MNARRRLAVVCAVLLATACSDRQATAPGPVFAPGGGGGPSVNATDPNTAPQETTLDVRVLGSGFDNGSRVTFLKGGLASPRFTTNSTRFVSSTELVANVTIAVDADTGAYDVQVETSRGKKGIGTELFSVKKLGNSETADPEIAYVNAGELHVANGSGARATNLGVPANWYPTWARRGNGTATSPYAIAYEPPGGFSAIGLVDVDTVGGTPRATNARLLAVDAPYMAVGPAWSPVGDTIVFGGEQTVPIANGLFLVTTTNGTPIRLTTLPSGASAQLPAWAPAGDAIAYIEQPGWVVRVLNRGSGVATTVVAAGVLDTPMFPAFSPDGSRLAVEASRPAKGRNTVRAVYLVPLARNGTGDIVATGAPVLLGDGRRPAWTASGGALVVDGLRLMDATTGASQNLGIQGVDATWRR